MAQDRRNNLANLAALNRRWRLELNELQRIQNKLEEFLSRQEAQEIAVQIHDIALEVDDNIDQIVQDPLAGRLYEYDGRFFTPKYRWGFHRAFDGVNVLRSLSKPTLETFFCAREKGLAISWLMDELGKHVWEAKIRRINWEQSQTLSVLPKHVLDEIVRNVRAHAMQAAEDSAPFSPEEEIFFTPFEQQMQS